MLTYPDWERLLARGGFTLPPSEMQGCLCGYLASGAERVSAWLALFDEECAPGDVLAQECHTALRELFAATWAVLQAAEFNLDLLLPDDAQPLAIRVQALRAWCEGFLYGYGASGMQRMLQDAERLALLRDIEQIGQAELESGDEAEERAYAELVEFIRMAATSLYLDHHTETEHETSCTHCH